LHQQPLINPERFITIKDNKSGKVNKLDRNQFKEPKSSGRIYTPTNQWTQRGGQNIISKEIDV